MPHVIVPLPRNPRSLALLALVLVVSAAPACAVRFKEGSGAFEDSSNAKYRIRQSQAAASSSQDASAPVDAVFALSMTKKADGDDFGFVRFNRSLYPPFRVSMVAGLEDRDASTGFVDGTSQFCMELDERGSVTDDIGTLQWVLICAVSEGNGIRVRGQDQFAQLGNVLIPDTKVVCLAMEHDGTDLIFEAGATSFAADGDGGMTEVARINDFVVDDAYLPSFGASFLAFPAEVSFDRLRVEFSGEPPAEGGVPGATAIAHDLYAALDGMLEAAYDLDGVTPDATSARARLVDAVAVLDEALLTIPMDVPPGKPQKKALAAVKKAGTAAAGVIKKLDKGKPPQKLAKSLGKALAGVLGAIERLDPVQP